MSVTPGGRETWNWDEPLFAGAAGYYEQGRLPYAPGYRPEELAAEARQGTPREVLAQASPAGRFAVRLPDNILRIWRLPASRTTT